MTEMHCSPQGYAVNKAFEGRATRAYRDEVGVWTIGYGNTNYDASVLGFTIAAGTIITEAQCDQLLVAAMTRRYEPAVNEAMGHDPQPSQAAFDAGCSFHYNTGAIKRASWVQSFVARNLPAVHSQIIQWNKAGGNVLAGLTRRRNREWLMISQGDYGPEGSATPIDIDTGKAVPTAPGVTLPERVYPGVMRLGDKGPEVADEQKQLVAVGYTVPTDGTFDAKTEAAVADYQRRHPQLIVDGALGPATKTALKRDAALKDDLKTTAVRGGGTGATISSIDALFHGVLPWEVYVVLGVVIGGALCATIWNYRDELRALLTRKGRP